MFYMKNIIKNKDLLSYIGFVKNHPHDDYSILRFGFQDEDEFNKENIYNIVQYSCMKAKEHLYSY